jgi:flagellar assembly factor FliW
MMMIIETAQFGDIEIEENEVIHFSVGLPGFEIYKRFILFQPAESAPFSFMQSADNRELSFIVTSPFDFYGDYEVELSDNILQELNIENQNDVAIWSIVSIGDSLDKATVNLLAPIVVNRTNREARQIILHGTEYKTKHPLLIADGAAR